MSTPPAPLPVREAVAAAAASLQRLGSPTGRLDADLLLASVLGVDRMGLIRDADRPLSDAERDAFRALIRRRMAGEPIAYILGNAGFWDIELAVDARVLIPRPDTERVVELALQHTARFEDADWRIVDVGTGSGALALALANALPRARVLAIDISADALEVARDNATRLGLRDRVKFVRGDLLEPLAARPQSVDIIVANPPYVADNDPDLAADVAKFEPAVALYGGGSDGLDVVRRLLPAAARALAPGGLLLVEHGARQGAAVRAIAAQHFADPTTERDLARHDRVLVARAPGVCAIAERAARPVERTEAADADAATEPLANAAATFPASAPPFGHPSAVGAEPGPDLDDLSPQPDEAAAAVPPLPVVDLRDL